MHIGRCENCKYMDLVENVGSKCPRCGARMVSLGVDSLRWNRMSIDTKNAIILEIFPEEAEPKEDTGAGPDDISGETAADEQTAAAGETMGTAEPAAAWEQAHAKETVNLPAEEISDAGKPEIPAAGNEQASKADDLVYVCYSCNGITGHDASHDRYFCTECGSEMINVGYPVSKWTQLSKEEKRKIAEDAKIRHMVTEIKKAKIEDGGESTPNIINVV